MFDELFKLELYIFSEQGVHPPHGLGQERLARSRLSDRGSPARKSGHTQRSRQQFHGKNRQIFIDADSCPISTR